MYIHLSVASDIRITACGNDRCATLGVCGIAVVLWFSGRLQQPGSSEWCVAETNRQRGNDRLLHNTSEMESTMWWQPVEGNHRRLHGLGSV